MLARIKGERDWVNTLRDRGEVKSKQKTVIYPLLSGLHENHVELSWNMHGTGKTAGTSLFIWIILYITNSFFLITILPFAYKGDSQKHKVQGRKHFHQ